MADEDDKGRVEGTPQSQEGGSADPGTNSEAGGGEGENAEVITEREKGLQKQVADLETQRDAANSRADSTLADSKRDELLSRLTEAANKPKERTQADEDADLEQLAADLDKAIEDEKGGKAFVDILVKTTDDLDKSYAAKDKAREEKMQKALDVMTAKIEGNSPEMVASREKIETLKEQLGDGYTPAQLLEIAQKVLPKDQPDRPLAPGTTETVVASAAGEESEMSDEQANQLNTWLGKDKALSKEERKALSRKGAAA